MKLKKTTFWNETQFWWVLTVIWSNFGLDKLNEFEYQHESEYVREMMKDIWRRNNGNFFFLIMAIYGLSLLQWMDWHDSWEKILWQFSYLVWLVQQIEFVRKWPEMTESCVENDLRWLEIVENGRKLVWNGWKLLKMCENHRK